MISKEYSRYLINAETNQRYENNSDIIVGTQVRHVHDQTALGIILSPNHEFSSWCNAFNILWSIEPYNLTLAKNSMEEVYSCLSAFRDDTFDLNSDEFDDKF